MKTESKHTYNVTLEQLQAIGGKLWESGNNKRVYFNNLEEIFGLRVTYYSSGNVCGAKLDGDMISNSDAKYWLEFVSGSAKFYYDCNTMHFVAEHQDKPQTLMNHCLRNVKALLGL